MVAPEGGELAAELPREEVLAVKRSAMAWLWPSWPGLAVPGLWAAYIGYVLLCGQVGTWQGALVALWPLVPLYVGSCLLARLGRHPRLGALLAVGAILAAVDLAVKAWIEARLPQGQAWPLLPGLLSVDRVYNVYGTMLAIPGAKPFVTVLAVALVPGSLVGYRYYLAREEPVAWAHAAFVGFFAGALAKAGDLLLRGLIVDYLHIPGLPVADLADIYLLWLGGGCALAASFCYPGTWPSPRRFIQGLLGRGRGE